MHQDWPVNMPIGFKEKFEAQFPQLLENAGGLEQGSRCYVTGVIKVTEHSFGSLSVYVICQIMAKERLQLTS